MLILNFISSYTKNLYIVKNISNKNFSLYSKCYSPETEAKIKYNFDNELYLTKTSNNDANIKYLLKKPLMKTNNHQKSFYFNNNIDKNSINFISNKNFCEKHNKNNSNHNEESSAHSKQIEKEFLKLDYYSILNIKHNFNESELRKNYVQLAKHFHPDRFKGSPEIFKKLSEAYQTLKDENKREEYNRKLKIRIHKHYKKSKNETGYKTDENQEELRKASKYEEDFKKLNIEKLFHDFSKKKIKTSHEKIKTYKTNLEKKMNPREHKIYEMVLEYKQSQLLTKDTKYNFYKEFGLIKEEKIEKNYSELVKEEIERIKNKNVLYENIKKKEKEQEKKEDEYNIKLKIFVKRLLVFYILSVFFVLYYKFKNVKETEQYMKRSIEESEQKRFSNYVYIGNSKI